MSSVENKRNLLREGSFVEPEIKNPFVHKLTIPFKDKIKVGLGFFIKKNKCFFCIKIFLF